MNTVSPGARPANPAMAIVSAVADRRMAMDAMQMAQRAYEQTRDAMMQSATDANWWSWQIRVDAAKRNADEAVTRVIEASKAVARANVAACPEVVAC